MHVFNLQCIAKAFLPRLQLFCSLLAVLFVLNSRVFAADIFVSTSGSSGGSGSISSPLRSVQAAIDRSQAGDSIFMRGGTYFEYFTFRKSGAAGRPITLKNYQNEKVIIDIQGSHSTPGRQVLLQAQEGHMFPIGWINIEGLEIARGYVGIKMYNAHDVIIRNNHIHDSGTQGILGNGYNVLFDRNIISYTAAPGTGAPSSSNLEHGIYITGSYLTFTNNIFHSNLGYGIQLAAYPYSASSYAGQEYAWAKNCLISNNTFAYQKNRGAVVLWQGEASDNVIQNNIFYDNSQSYAYGSNGVQFVDAGARNILRNNLYYSPLGRVADQGITGSTVSSNTGVVTGDPLFTGAFDFRLRTGSPALNKGYADSRIDHDYVGTTRPQNGQIDIGAYETSSNAAPAAPRNFR